MELFTVGHSNHSIEDFVSLLKQHEITAIADVRSHPYSRYLPHFNKAELQAVLEQVKVRYVFLGQELGARPNDLSCYNSLGKALYERIAATSSFDEGIQRLLRGVKSYRIALMCGEKDPITCHRTILVCRHLRQFNLRIHHILSNGELETQAELEQRILRKFNKSSEQNQAIQLSLFESSEPEEEIDLEQAYQRQGDEIAYVKPNKNTQA